MNSECPGCIGTSGLITLRELVPQTCSTSICVASFSEVPDLLSQWRGYGGRSGYSVGFKTAALVERSEDQGYFLARCLYDVMKQRSLISELLDECVRIAFPVMVEEAVRTGGRVGGSFEAYVDRVAPILKHPSFREEREWRLITRPRMTTTLQFREGLSMLIPYTAVRLGAKTKYLESVTIGPAAHPELAKSAVELLLRSCEILPDTVRCVSSNVPYRAW